MLDVDGDCSAKVRLSPNPTVSLLTLHREGKIDERFQDQYERLVEIRNQLDRLSVTQAWSLRETDLFGYQRKLDRIDEARVNGNFVDAEGQLADIHAQRVRVQCITTITCVLT